MTVPPANRTPIASYSWGGFGSQNDITQFRQVFQPEQGIFSPGYPLVPPERERVRVWDFPVGYNTIYTPRAYDPIGFAELRALAEHHDITRLAIETRKDRSKSSSGRYAPAPTGVPMRTHRRALLP
jgi:hypothetical protein